MARTVRIGVIGLGSVSEKYVPHIRTLNMEGNACEVIIARDLRPGLAERARAWSIPTFTTDDHDVMEHPEVDVILILTGMQTHGKLTREALLSGKHVLVEKPMSMDLADAADLVALAKVSKGYLVCAPHVTLSETYQAMWRHIHSGDIGRPLSARGLYGWAGPDWDPFFYEPGGGPRRRSR
jgi:predicted dehydrogenase